MSMLPAPPPAGYPPAPASVAMARRQVNVPHVVIAWSCAVLSLGYLLPWAIAATRAKSNSLAIALVNFLLGWTAIGWIVALVMSCGSEPQGAVVNVYAQQNT